MHGSNADSQCLSLFLSRRIFILVCSPNSMKLLLKFPLASVGFGIPWWFFPLCLCLLSMCSAVVSCSDLLFSCSSSILVPLKDDKGTEIALHAVLRGVILWFPGESKLASCLLVSFLGFFGFLFLLLFWNLYAEGSASQETIFNQTTAAELSHTPLPKTVSKIT